MANKVVLFVTLALLATLVAADATAPEAQKSRKLLRWGSMWAQQETSAAIERAVMSGADPDTTRYATWVGSASARATTGRNRWGRGSWWDRK